MDIFETIKLSFTNLYLNKFRSFLTMLGIIIGISSVIAITAIGNGFKKNIIEDTEKVAARVIMVEKNKRAAIKNSDILTNEDIERLKLLPNVEKVMPSYDTGYFDKKTGIYRQISGYSTAEFKLYVPSLVSGSYFTKEEMENQNSNAIIIDNLEAKKEYKGQNPIGKIIKIENNLYKIVGVYKPANSYVVGLFGNGSFYQSIVPQKTISKYYPINKYELLTVVVKNVKDVEKTVQEIQNYIAKNKPTKGAYNVKSGESEIKQFTSIYDKIARMITLIAFISLVVSGIGVMNIMLVTVTERITEIGTRKALGAKQKDIRRQFLIEASILTLIGGVIGLLLGYGVSYIIGVFIKVPPVVTFKNVIIAMAVSIFMGIFFGIYPANKASKLSPMEAMRKE